MPKVATTTKPKVPQRSNASWWIVVMGGIHFGSRSMTWHVCPQNIRLMVVKNDHKMSTRNCHELPRINVQGVPGLHVVSINWNKNETYVCSVSCVTRKIPTSRVMAASWQKREAKGTNQQQVDTIPQGKSISNSSKQRKRFDHGGRCSGTKDGRQKGDGHVQNVG